MAGARLRRSRCLVAFWEEGEFVLQSYLTGKQTRVSPLVAHLLGAAEEYRPSSGLSEIFARIPDAHAIVSELVEQDVLVVEGSSLDERERLLERTWRWGQDARFFHYSTQQTLFEHDPDAQRDALAARAREVPPPSPFRDRGGAAVPLSGSVTGRQDGLWEVLRARRTIRRFARAPLPLPVFSELMLWTWGQTATIEDPEVGRYVLKTSPSGGARHPVEVYPVVLRVEGLEPGIYHYSVARHALEPVRSGSFDELVVRLCANQAWVGDAAAVFFMTAALERSMWKYEQSHAYRVLLLDSGHLGQTFHLVCTALGLAPFTTAATMAEEIEQALGVDGITEIALYTAAAGIPAPRSSSKGAPD